MLLSGNGRHRRPRPTPKFVVAAGITGAGVAIPLIGATGAEAATPGTWDNVAECESGNAWSINSGNGYFGGLQLSQSTWDEYGGQDYAPRPDLASRTDQIAVAEKVLAALGPAAWPSCSLVAGLAPAGDEAELPVEVPEVPVPDTDQTPPDDSAEPETPVEAAPGSPGRTGPTGVPGTDAPAEGEEKAETPGERPGGDPAEDEVPSGRDDPDTVVVPETELIPEPVYEQELTVGDDGGQTRTGDDDPERASRGSGKHRSEPEPYTVALGDTLGGIAADEDVDGGWRALYKVNKDTIGDDPDAIVPGQRLKLG